MPRTQTILLLNAWNHWHVTPLPCTAPPMWHVKNPNSEPFLKMCTTDEGKRTKVLWAFVHEAKARSLFWIWGSTISLLSIWQPIKWNHVQPVLSPTTPHLPILDPLILVFRFGRSAETTAHQHLELQSDLAAPLCWPPGHLARRDQSTAWQHPGTNAHTHTTHRRALIQTNASYFMSVCRTAGSQRGNRMFLARFVASQRAGLKPKSGVKAQSRTESDAGFTSSRFI